MDLLYQIKDDIQKYAETISKVIDLQVEVMSKNFIRVAGTGILRDKISENMFNEAHIYKEVLKTGKTIVIKNPREEKLCIDCASRKNCKEILEVSTPIIFNSEIVGVIGLICFNEEQKNSFLLKEDYYIGFIEQMSMFISSRIYQENEKIMIENNNRVLLKVVDRIPNAIIITNENSEIELINETGTSLFGDLPLKAKLNTTTLSEFSDKKEFFITCNEITHKVVGDIIDFSKNMGRFRTLYIFQEADKFREYVQQFNSNFIKDFVFTSFQMQNVYLKIQKVAKTTTTTLITGESGTGKEVVAKAIHMNSNRAEKPFIPVNCGAIPESLIESEFFGYAKGAFTGANPNGKIGFFEQANGGTIFLDEIGDMPLSLQVKLLRVLQEKTITPIGSNKIKEVDVRIITATNRNLEELVKENRFREDLYYRLNVFPIYIPPLRERPTDIVELATYFIEKYSQLFNTPSKLISNEVKEFFLTYSWPGNIRELKNIIEYAINVIDEKENIIFLKHLPPRLANSFEDKQIKTLAELEKEAIKNLLEKFGSSSKDKVKIAKTLDISLATLYRKIKQYNL